MNLEKRLAEAQADKAVLEAQIAPEQEKVVEAITDLLKKISKEASQYDGQAVLSIVGEAVLGIPLAILGTLESAEEQTHMAQVLSGVAQKAAIHIKRKRKLKEFSHLAAARKTMQELDPKLHKRVNKARRKLKRKGGRR